jgi:hypothetical protein
MAKLFISYRREDSGALVGRIYDRLVTHFGVDSVFMDIDSIPYGVDFRDHIGNAVGECDVFIAVIGKQWLSAERDGKSRLDDPDDFVRTEIETALARKIPLIPVLIKETPMPKATELPYEIGNLAHRNAAEVDPGRDFHPHLDRLIRKIEEVAIGTSEVETVPDSGEIADSAGSEGGTPTTSASPQLGLSIRTTSRIAWRGLSLSAFFAGATLWAWRSAKRAYQAALELLSNLKRIIVDHVDDILFAAIRAWKFTLVLLSIPFVFCSIVPAYVVSRDLKASGEYLLEGGGMIGVVSGIAIALGFGAIILFDPDVKFSRRIALCLVAGSLLASLVASSLIVYLQITHGFAYWLPKD